MPEHTAKTYAELLWGMTSVVRQVSTSKTRTGWVVHVQTKDGSERDITGRYAMLTFMKAHLARWH